MTLESLLVPGALFAAVVLSRGAHRFRARQLGSDSWFHLTVAETVRQNRGRYPDSIPRFLLSGPFDYPPLLHYLLALFSRTTRDRIEGWVGPVVDGIHTLFLWGLIFALTQNPWSAATAALLFILSPLLLRGAERVLTLTPKPMGDLWVSLAMISLYFYWVDHSPFWLALLAVWTALLLLTQRFGTQALLFLVVAVSAVYLNALPLVGLAGGLGLALALSWGHYWTVLRGHIGHLDHWRTFMVDHYHGVRHESFWRDFGRLGRELRRNPRRAFIIAYRNPVLNYFVYNPWILVAFYVLLSPGTVPDHPFFRFAGVWMLATVGLVVLISMKSLKFLGKPELYGEYGIFPQAAVLGMAAGAAPGPLLGISLAVLALYSVGAIIVNIRVVLRSDQNFSKAETQDLLEFLRRQPPSRLLPIPMNWGYAMAYLTPHEVLGWNSTFKILDRKYGIRRLFTVFPYPDPRQLPEILREYRIRWVVRWKPSRAVGSAIKALLAEGTPALSYDFSAYRRVFENDKFEIYDLSILPD